MRSSSFCLAHEVFKCLKFKRDYFIFYILLQVNFLQVFSQRLCSYIMASPGDKKGQRRGLCGHIMASFDLHKRCARCRDKGNGDDDCVEKRPCVICDGFTETQKEMLATPTYKILKDKKSGVLISPDQVTVIASVEDKEPTFHSSPPASHPSVRGFQFCCFICHF